MLLGMFQWARLYNNYGIFTRKTNILKIEWYMVRQAVHMADHWKVVAISKLFNRLIVYICADMDP